MNLDRYPMTSSTRDHLESAMASVLELPKDDVKITDVKLIPGRRRKLLATSVRKLPPEIYFKRKNCMRLQSWVSG